MATNEWVIPEKPLDLLGTVRNGTWLDAQEFPPLQWAVKGVIPEGMGLVVGPPKLGKSWFVLGIGLAIAEGGCAFGKIRVEQRPFLYAALEDSAKRMQRRTQHLTFGQALPEAFEFFTEPPAPGTITAVIDAWLNLHPNGVVALDTLGRVMPPAKPGQTTYERDYQVGAALKSLADHHPGSSLLVVHHTRKMASTDFMDATSGTNGLNGSADFTIVLERVRGEESARIKLTGRDVEEAEYAAHVSDGFWQLDGDTLTDSARIARSREDSEGLGNDSAAVVEFVGQHPEGVGSPEVALYMGWEKNKARSYLSRLCDANRIKKVRRGIYGPISNTVASVASVAFDATEVPTELSVASVASVAFEEGDNENATDATDATLIATQETASLPGKITDATDATHSVDVTPSEDPKPIDGLSGSQIQTGNLRICSVCGEPMADAVQGSMHPTCLPPELW
ncbi:MAG: AAA family ATPase [Ancrocorticia sp.]|jgi:hypothetical protein|nr:AAA family ATPase [Ancrocorticia sp.]MCI2003093.1 AAA family ATPase [Ancrocorticia sp.]